MTAFTGIAVLNTFFLFLNPFYHHKLEVLGNLFRMAVFFLYLGLESHGYLPFSLILTQVCSISDEKLYYLVNIAHLLISVKT